MSLDHHSAAHPETLTAEQQRELRRLARSTWLYFEHFIGPEDHWLPPDHFQEDPRGLVAHRTSPTNVGLMLVSTLAAYDFGYVGIWELAQRLQNSLQSLAKLEMYAGHFLNWYDTRSREPLPPRYVSTVDSGNLACCLVTLRQGCLGIEQTLLPRWQRWQGVLDTLDMLDASLPGNALQTELRQFRQRILDVRQVPDQWSTLQQQFVEATWPQFEQGLSELVESHQLTTDQLRRIRLWTERLRYHMTDMQRRLKALMPWTFYLHNPPALFADLADDTPLAVAWQALLTTLPVQVRAGDIVAVCETAQARLADLRE
jgi:cyclic beta-1,2-glucan synthetase